MWGRDVDEGDRFNYYRDPVLVAGSPSARIGFTSASFGGSAGRRYRSSTLGLARRLWQIRRGTARQTVTCIACGQSVLREEAREYDKQGDRWDREAKRFEYLCKGCHGELSHQPRDEVEALCVELGAGDCSREEFIEWYCELVEERYGPLDHEE